MDEGLFENGAEEEYFNLRESNTILAENWGGGHNLAF